MSKFDAFLAGFVLGFAICMGFMLYVIGVF